MMFRNPDQDFNYSAFQPYGGPRDRMPMDQGQPMQQGGFPMSEPTPSSEAFATQQPMPFGGSNPYDLGGGGVMDLGGPQQEFAAQAQPWPQPMPMEQARPQPMASGGGFSPQPLPVQQLGDQRRQLGGFGMGAGPMVQQSGQQPKALPPQANGLARGLGDRRPMPRQILQRLPPQMASRLRGAAPQQRRQMVTRLGDMRRRQGVMPTG